MGSIQGGMAIDQTLLSLMWMGGSSPASMRVLMDAHVNMWEVTAAGLQTAHYRYLPSLSLQYSGHRFSSQDTWLSLYLIEPTSLPEFSFLTPAPQNPQVWTTMGTVFTSLGFRHPSIIVSCGLWFSILKLGAKQNKCVSGTKAKVRSGLPIH